MSYNVITGQQANRLVWPRGATLQREDGVIDEKEFKGMISRAETIRYADQYYRLRDLAAVCIFKKTGKRRIELTRLKVSDLTIDKKNRELSIVFHVAKKRSKDTTLISRVKSIDLKDSAAKPILQYLQWLKENNPNCQYLFPHTGYSPFKNGTVIIDESRPCHGRTLLRSVKKLNPKAYAHLFRYSAATEIVRRDQSIMAVFKIKTRLDLASYLTAFNYLERGRTDRIESDSNDRKDRIERS